MALILINADTDEAIGPLSDGDVIDFSTLGTNNLTIVAEVGAAPVGSIGFGYNGNDRIRTENIAPYALGGDNNGDFRAFSFTLGENTVSATPFTGSNRSGSAGLTATVNFTIVSGGPAQEVSFDLVNADSNETIGAIADGDVLDLANFPETGLSIIAIPSEEGAGSVVFGFNGANSFNTENVAPYALDGDNAGDYLAVNFPLGTNTVTATVFNAAGGNGIIEGSATITFEVIDSSVASATDSPLGRISPNPVEDVAQFSMEDSGKQVLTGIILNLSGQVVSPYFEVDVNDQGNGFMNVSTLSQGIYVIRLTDANGKIVSQIKIVKK